MRSIIAAIDSFNEKIGQLNSLLVLPLVGVVVYEIIMRYLFNAPTVWGFEMTMFIYGVHYMLGLALTENREGHVKVEILTSRFSKKGQAWFNIIGYALLFFPVFGMMAYAAVAYAWTSIGLLEVNNTSWAPPIWPVKSLMALGFVMLFLQGLNTFLKNIQMLREIRQ
ncbi:TRAP transporter small permease subunit [Desulforhopalus singaporensis]|uniref:TRAP-type mannitol/chloroaromatic compound transport system, small permease component n=1 Tax=Desulforhopalus singaporensis TaxID=91360 RepID=A0A1H0PR85_9BACT|nr:TRAP transporter small permease subunit [Desulforhopalus singaporensis]SDP07310.1 TRAP-type mannitol/chloroaromatic compound transport system, small permease component [Desulforhopalus singaporensis]